MVEGTAATPPVGMVSPIESAPQAQNFNINSVNFIDEVGFVESSNQFQLDKLLSLALTEAILSDDDEKKGENFLLQAILMAILFGEDATMQSEISPIEQAKMIAEVLGSGEPGSYSKAMAMAGNGAAQGMTYGASGAVGMSASIGGVISTGA